eukprot:c15302_g1_i1.p1 GENE.c15302_g1_i1~~c15302_g1_i1.p1  ORF type:complete len:150 (+),score=25.14 c15302_g1_i1:60-452(+)
MTPEEVAGLLSRLNKKDTFVEAVTELQQAISEYPRCAADTQAALFKAVKRTHVLLTTRYSSTIAWIAGRALFVQAASSFDDEPTKALIADMILSADLHCVEVVLIILLLLQPVRSQHQAWPHLSSPLLTD